MTEEQLLALIKSSPVLAHNFENWITKEFPCPCCIKGILEFPDQHEAETVVNTIAEAGNRYRELHAQIDELTRGLREELEKTDERLSQAIHRFYEIQNAKLFSTR